ncbi:MAG: type IV secretion system protein [Rickettsiaceae bacterium]|nr:type IV secretion system protein [Rickettsiaceae bacterium]
MQKLRIAKNNFSTFFRVPGLLPGLILIMMIWPSSSYSNFGTSCTGIDTNYIDVDTSRELSNSAYSLVLSLIDIQNAGDNMVDGCQEQDPRFINVSIKNINNSDSYATPSNSRQFKFEAGASMTLGSMTDNPIVSSDHNIASIELTAGLLKDKICIVMPTQFGYKPLVCRDTRQVILSDSIRDMSQCSNISPGCRIYDDEYNPSKLKNNVFGLCVQCFKESLDMIFFNPKTCYESSAYNTDIIDQSARISVTPFAEFHRSLVGVVYAALILYVMILGMDIALKPEEFKIEAMFINAAKMLAVIFFSVGMQYTDWYTQRVEYRNGITYFVLPMALKYANQMSNYILKSSSNQNLCFFEENDYQPGYGYYAFWDGIDCRLNIFSGLLPVLFRDETRAYFIRHPIPGEPSSKPPGISYSEYAMHPALLSDKKFLDTAPRAGNSLPKGIPIMILMACLILGGKGILSWVVPLAMMILMTVFSITLLISYVVSIMIIYILAYIAPLFVPMALFGRTKGFYEGWLNLLISCTLQPVIYLALGSFCIAIIDTMFFDGCVFAKYEDLQDSRYVFGLMIPDDAEKARTCKESLGYTLMRYYQTHYGWKDFNALLFHVWVNVDPGNLLKKSWFGLFVCFFVYYFTRQMHEIAESLSNGMSLGSISQSFGEMQEGVKKLVIDQGVKLAEKYGPKEGGKK